MENTFPKLNEETFKFFFEENCESTNQDKDNQPKKIMETLKFLMRVLLEGNEIKYSKRIWCKPEYFCYFIECISIRLEENIRKL